MALEWWLYGSLLLLCIIPANIHTQVWMFLKRLDFWTLTIQAPIDCYKRVISSVNLVNINSEWLGWGWIMTIKLVGGGKLKL